MSNRSLIKIDGDFSVRSAEVSSEPRTHALHYKRSIGGSLFLGAFLAAFCAPYFLTDTAAGPEDSLFRLVTFLFSAFWMLGWSVGVAFIALLFLGSIFGRECLVVSPGQLVIRMELFGAGFSRTVRGSEITNLRRVEPESGEALSWRGPHLTLDYEGAAINFGCNVDRNRAELLISDINSIGLRKSVPLPRIDDANYADRRPRESHTPFRGNSIPEYATPPLTLTSLSTISLFAANLVPVVGVLMFGWSIGEVMLLYWAESAVIGFYNICKMWVIGRWAVLFMGPFFLGHYGAFMAIHLLFIYGLMIKGPNDSSGISLAEVMRDFESLAPAIAALLVSHGVSFSRNFLKRREFEQKKISEQMAEPYRRIVVMHLTIIFGGFLVMMFDNALPVLVLMICLKVGADLRAHFREHK